MATVVMDRQFAEQLRQQRAAAGSDRWDEVWEGTYMMTTLANNEHQELVGGFVDILREALAGEHARVYPGANVSDREQDWTYNYRCPDVAVFLANTSAKNCQTHWRGGPDFAVEIASPDDMVRDKIPFYGKVAMRELLIVDREPWRLELFQLSGVELKSVGTADETASQHLHSAVLSLTFGLTAGAERPSITVTRSADGKSWEI